MPKLQRPDTTIEYELYGPATAPRLLVLSPSNTSMDELFPSLIVSKERAKASRLARSFRVLMFDHRGTGASGKPIAGVSPTWPEPNPAAFMNDTLALLERLGWDSASVLAFSFGATVVHEILQKPSSQFRIENLLMVCPAADMGVGPGLSYPMQTMLTSAAEERAERNLRLADTRRDHEWFSNGAQGEAILAYVTNKETVQEETPGAFEGRCWQTNSRIGVRNIPKLRAACGLPPEAPPPGAPSADAEEAPAAAEAAPAPGVGSAPPEHWPKQTCLFAATHDGITPPSASLRLHRAYAGSTLVWWATPTGHWPNLATQAGQKYHEAAVAFLLGNGVASGLVSESAANEAAIQRWDAPAVPSSGCLEGGCAIL